MQVPGIPRYWAIFTGDTEWERLPHLVQSILITNGKLQFEGSYPSLLLKDPIFLVKENQNGHRKIKCNTEKCNNTSI